MTSQQNVELGIRAAHLAKAALAMLGTQDLSLAKLQFRHVVEEVKQLDEFLTAVPQGGRR